MWWTLCSHSSALWTHGRRVLQLVHNIMTMQSPSITTRTRTRHSHTHSCRGQMWEDGQKEHTIKQVVLRRSTWIGFSKFAPMSTMPTTRCLATSLSRPTLTSSTPIHWSPLCSERLEGRHLGHVRSLVVDVLLSFSDFGAGLPSCCVVLQGMLGAWLLMYFFDSLSDFGAGLPSCCVVLQGIRYCQATSRCGGQWAPGVD